MSALSKSYYDKKIFIPQVDENDSFISPIERWQAHEKGILHRAFTVAVFYKGQIICQHRKHPVFDGWFDLTASSHPQIIEGNIQSNEEAVILTLKREWGLESDQISHLKNIGSVTYKSPDTNSKYIEHEFCHFFIAETNIRPTVNNEIAYGFTLQTLGALQKESNPLFSSLAPWVKEALERKLFMR